MTSPEPIFDRRLLERRRLRAVRMAEGSGRAATPRSPARTTAIATPSGPPEFLVEQVADDIAWRLSAVKRSFAQAVVLGGQPMALARRLAAAPNVGAVTVTESSAALLAVLQGFNQKPAPAAGEWHAQVADEVTLPFAEASIDLLVSGLALQWVDDLLGTLIQIRRSLRPDGLMIAALIGGRTLFELREAFLAAEAEIEGGASPRVAPFADVRDLGGLMQRARFALPVTDVDTITVTYADPLALMLELRAMGAGNVLTARRRTPLRRATLARAIEIYGHRFGMAGGRIPATFEIVTLTGWAPHASQPKPLAPGSATARLADVLGTREQPLPGDSGDPEPNS